MSPKKQKKLIFLNECNCIVDYELLEKAMLWYSDKNLMVKRKIYLYGLYPAVSIFDEKIHIHRLLLLYRNKGIITKGLVTHHINHNKLDCSINNLQLIPCQAHTAHHLKGRILTNAQRNRIIEYNRSRKGISHKKKYNISLIEIKEHLFKGLSINQIAKIYGCDWSTIKARIIDNPELLEAI